MSWTRASVSVAGDAVDAVCEALEALGAASVSIEPGDDEAILEPPPGAAPLWRRTRVAALFDDASPELRDRVLTGLVAHGIEEVELRPLASRDWENAWRRGAAPRHFGHGLWVLPREADEPGNARAVVRLDPGLAFGTGSHPTTALCLAWLAPRALAGRVVLDLGCGSGILAIAAARMGAARVLAVDNDPQALVATRENAAMNGVEGCIDLHPCLPAQARVDMVLANILANALVDLAGVVTAACRVDADLALSGILTGQRDEVWRHYRAAFTGREDRLDGEWALIGARRCDDGPV